MTIESRITTFQDLYDLAQRYRRNRWVFRGVSRVDFHLIPKVGRPPIMPEYEKRIFDFFIREAVPYLSNVPTSEWEWLALAQHYGLPTRLLDWTENPLIAAYFSCSEYEHEDAAIYMLKTSKLIKEETYKSPFTVTEIARYRPRHITRRISAQRGLFTVHHEPQSPVLLADGGEFAVHRAIIESGFKRKLRWNLSRFGFNRHTLFPDLDGLALHIMWIFSGDDPSEEEEM